MSYLEKLRRLPKGPSAPAAGDENFKESLPAALPKLPKGGFDSTQGGRNSEKTPPPEHQGTRTESQWEDLTSIIAVLEHHPQLWPGLRAYCRQILPAALFDALEAEGYDRRPAKPVPDPVQQSRHACLDCVCVDTCPTPGVKAEFGLVPFHMCDSFRAKQSTATQKTQNTPDIGDQ